MKHEAHPMPKNPVVTGMLRPLLEYSTPIVHYILKCIVKSIIDLLSLLIWQDDDKSFRRAPSWRKKFRPKDVKGLAAGSAETLPANFRVTSSMSSPSMQPKKMQIDGKILLTFF